MVKRKMQRLDGNNDIEEENGGERRERVITIVRR